MLMRAAGVRERSRGCIGVGTGGGGEQGTGARISLFFRPQLSPKIFIITPMTNLRTEIELLCREELIKYIETFSRRVVFPTK